MGRGSKATRAGPELFRVGFDEFGVEALPELLSFADLLIGQIGPGPARRQVRSALCQRQPPTATRSPEESYPEISTFSPPFLPTHSLSFTLTHRVPVLVYHS